MNLQRLIEQHPAAPAVIMPIAFLCLWFFVSASISVIGGWSSLAKVYRAQVPFDGTKWSGQSAQMRWLANYNRVLTMGVNPQGLYLSSMFLFRFMHPPLLVPWSDIKVRSSQSWGFGHVTLTMGQDLAIPLRIRAKLAARMRESAGSYWPVEEM
jgi:hypothetical protein